VLLDGPAASGIDEPTLHTMRAVCATRLR